MYVQQPQTVKLMQQWCHSRISIRTPSGGTHGLAVGCSQALISLTLVSIC